METEEILPGGNMSAVSRVGDTVRRTSGPWTPQVHALLRHLRAKGIAEVPAPLGFDALGREILTYIPGTVGHSPRPELRTDAVLVAAARLLRRIHAATAEIAHLYPSGWQAPTRPPVEVLCHGDFAPYNCVFDGAELVGVIDFGHAHPGSRAWDLAYAVYRFAPIAAPTNPEAYGDLAEQSRRLRLFCDAYGLEERRGFIHTLGLRIASMAEYLEQGAAAGDARMTANIAAGHLQIYLTDHAYLQAHAEEFRRAVGEEGG
jgi:hypothetical protein